MQRSPGRVDDPTFDYDGKFQWGGNVIVQSEPQETLQVGGNTFLPNARPLLTPSGAVSTGEGPIPGIATDLQPRPRGAIGEQELQAHQPPTTQYPTVNPSPGASAQYITIPSS